MKAKNWIYLSGVLWLVIGVMLMNKGIGYLSDLSKLSVSQEILFALLLGALLLGFFKGRFVFVKTVNRIADRVLSIKGPITLANAYPKGYWIILFSMMFLGMGLRFVNIPLELRGFLDITVGSALVNGSMLYFRKARIVVD